MHSFSTGAAIILLLLRSVAAARCCALLAGGVVRVRREGELFCCASGKATGEVSECVMVCGGVLSSGITLQQQQQHSSEAHDVMTQLYSWFGYIAIYGSFVCFPVPGTTLRCALRCCVQP